MAKNPGDGRVGRTSWSVLLFWASTLLAQAPGTLLEQADAAFRDDRMESAAKLARQALTRDPNAVHAHMILGAIAARNGDWETSGRHFQAVVRLEPSNPYGYFYLGQAKLYQRQWGAAVQYFTQAAKRGYPERERLTVELALAQNENGQPEKALAGLSEIPPPSDPHLAAQYHAVAAFARSRINQPAQAIEAIEHALQLDGTDSQSWEFLIEALIHTDQAPRALAEAIRVQKKFPDDPDIQYLFALASFHVAESPLSGLALRNLREAKPDDPRVMLAEGLLHRKEGRSPEAAAAFRKAAAKGVKDAHLLLGLVLREDGEYDAAEREFVQAEKENPRNGQVLLELGKLLLNRGDLEGALTRLKQAAVLLPTLVPVHYQLGLVYRRLGRATEAEQHFAISKKLQAEQAATAAGR